MAIFNPGMIVGQISGKVAGVVFTRNRGGSVVRNGAVPVKVTTEKALAYKGYLAAASQAWVALTAAQRQSWGTFASGKTVTNRLGKSISLTGQNWYVALNSRLLAAGNAMISLPPTDPPPATPVITDFTVDAGTGDTELTFTPTPAGANIKLFIRGAMVFSPAVNNVENLLTTIIISAANAASPLDLEALLINAFGPLIEGASYILEVRALDTTTGLVSGRVFARTVCVTTP